MRECRSVFDVGEHASKACFLCFEFHMLTGSSAVLRTKPQAPKVMVRTFQVIVRVLVLQLLL